MSRVTRYRYPSHVILRDYLLSGLGFSLFLPPVALMNLPLVTDLIFSAVGGLFLIFGLQVFRRHRTRIQLSDDGLFVVPGGGWLPWDALSKLVLSYFTVRRDGARGWMELKLVSRERSVRVDSRLEGFSEIAACAARAARHNGLKLDPATVANLAAIGIHAPETGAPRDDRR